MIHYAYDLDGFTYTEDDAWVFEGADLSAATTLEARLQAAGWEVMVLHRGGGCGVTIYKHGDGIERGLYIDIRGLGPRVYTCLVMPSAWPQYYRTELLPIIQGHASADVADAMAVVTTDTTSIAGKLANLADITAGLERLISLIDERFPVKPPRVRPPRPPKDKPVEPPATTPPVVTPPVVTPPEKEKDKTK